MNVQANIMTLEGLLAEREINQVFWRYGRACDERDWPVFETVFTEDAKTDFGSHSKENSRAEIVAFLKRCLVNCGPTQHFFGGHFAEIAGDRATSRVSMRAFHQGLGAKSHLTLIVYGNYHLSWRRQPTGWHMDNLVFRAFAETGTREVLNGAW